MMDDMGSTFLNVECPVSLFHEDELLSSDSLIRISKKKRFELTFRNKENENISIYFDENPSVSLPTDGFRNQSCFFNGVYDNHLSALNLCDNKSISGIIITSKNYFAFEYRNGLFVLLPKTFPSCDFTTRSKRDAAPKTAPGYYSKLSDEKTRYLELALVLDNSMFKKYDSDEKKVTERAQATVNIVNALYFPLKVRVSLVYVEIWKEKDEFDVANAAEKTLDKFLEYRRKMIKEHPHDNAHLLTNIKFEQGVLGKAYKGTMCSFDYSGGVDVDHSTNPAAVAATLAHEIGHNFGMDHDLTDADTCSCPSAHCIMAPALGSIIPTYWSECSVNSIVNSFERGIDVCLENVPEKTMTKATCGNGIVEGNEECDCGRKDCQNKCCDGTICKLFEGAECAEGTCCDLKTCKPKPRATVCRSATGICDLAEYCNGETSNCPADFYMQDGHLCPERSDEYCYKGKCGSRHDQCVTIWGPDSQSAVPQCFNLNRRGDFGGNCGYDFHQGNFTACPEEDIQCGRLHCSTQSERPVIGTPQTVQPSYTYIRVGRTDHMCHVIKTTFSSGKKKERDYGMVSDGATCGTNKICVDTKCKPRAEVNKTVSLCTDNCNLRGFCNNVGNCHCYNGFGGIACEIPGYGGSVNSNTANVYRGITPSSVFLGLSLTVLVLFAIAVVVSAIREKRNLLLELWVWIKKAFRMEGVLVPVRRAPSPPDKNRHSSLNSSRVPTYDTRVTYSTKNDKPSYQSTPTLPNSLICSTNDNQTQQYRQMPIEEKNELQRVRSIRPNVPPPSVPIRPREENLARLYEEKAEELGLISWNSNNTVPSPSNTDDTTTSAKKNIPPPLPPKPPKQKQ